MAIQLVDTNAPGRTCALCKTGISWDVTFADCTYCRLPFCKYCWLQHQPSHALASVSMVHGDIHDLNNRNASAPCSACRKRAPGRYVCLDCHYTVCRGCWFSRGVNLHPHRSFKVIEAKCTVRSNAASTDPCCCDAATVNHCTSCSTGFSIGQTVIFCKTCYDQTNEPMYRCLSCYSLGRDHPSNHESWQWTFQVEKPGWLSSGIYCHTCAQPMRNPEALKGHAHRHFIDIYTEENLNQVIARSYRECQRKVMRVDGIVATGSEQCSLCLHKTSPISPLHCQQCDQVLKLCTHCVQYASKLHVHPIPRFNDDSSQGNLVQVQRPTSKPSPSGPQYSPATPSPQSPRPSQGSFGSAAPQPQRPAPGRPPTTGQTIPPRRQRIGSAPPQGLWSRPQSYGPAPTRPYGVTQQGDFLNDLTTSIAIASITQAVVGAESNAIYDGSGATGPTDAGNLDTGTAAADTGGAGATQDVSGVQGTDWTGQETWQDTTAAYDSGWAADDQALF